MLSIYIHIPFCKSKCGYCDFVSANRPIRDMESYAERLIREIKESKYKGLGADTVFMGGGTPSFIPAELMEKILNCVYETFPPKADCEITTELNPESTTPEKLRIYKKLGINRISMGVQAFQDKHLRTLGRIHTAKRACEAFYMIREAGFKNINLDFMFSYPGQTLKDWEETLLKAVRLSPEHISAYSLIIEENTDFFEKYKNFQTNDDLYRIMYCKANEILNENGYFRYEISNFAKPGYECRHNITYWRRYNYLGFGLSAHSMYDNVRFSNTDDFSEYMGDNIENYREELTERDIIGEFMFLGLRMKSGISLKEFKENFGKDLFDVFKKPIEKYKKLNLLDYDGERLWLTEEGVNVSNTVFVDFI